jgi:pimeloyl-ACP methyl ester carboxylesterase
VQTPTLTGLGERADELTPDVGLRTHVDDVVSAVNAGEPCVLVGHSHAGLLVREAADRAPGQVRRVVPIDGWAIPAPDPALVGVTDARQAAWLRERMTAHPLRTFIDATVLTGAVDSIPGTGIVCRPGAALPFDAFAGLGYDLEDLQSCHDAMVIAPDELADLLLHEASR